MNKLCGKLLIVAASCISMQAALAQSTGCDVVIINRGFEDPVLAQDEYSYFIPGWVVIGDSGAFNPAPVTYPGGSVIEGNNCGYVSCCAGGRAQGVMQQTLPASLAGNTTYDLSLYVGQRLETPWSNMRIQLLAGSTAVIDTQINQAPTAGTFSRRNFQFVCPPNHPAVGGRLQIRMIHEGTIEHQANFDEFRLTATPNCVSICAQPQSVRTCRGVTATFQTLHAGTGPFTYRWFKDGVALQNGRTAWGSTVSGADSVSLAISNVKPSDDGAYRLLVTNGCGSINTFAASLLVCPADFNCDGSVDVFDYLDFVDAMAVKALAADWNEDGIIDFFDYLDFMDEYVTGC